MFLAGENITAARLNRLKPKTYFVTQSSPLVGAVTSTLIPGCSQSITTEMANAEYTITWFVDFDLTTTTTGTQLARPRVDGTLTTHYADFAGEVATDRGTPGNQTKGTLGAAGTYLFELVATLGAGCTVNTASTMLIEISEVA